MKSFKNDKNVYMIVKVLFVIVALAVIAEAGYFVVNHFTQKLGVYTFEGDNFPFLPSDFRLLKKFRNQIGISEVDYTDTESLPFIETEISSVCRNNNYTPNGNFTYGEIFGSATIQINGYTYYCNNKPPDRIAWSFYITSNKKANLFDIKLTSQHLVGLQVP